MATQASMLELEDLTTCTICLETFTRPKVLPCQHSFCYACLMLLGKIKSTITCPYCQKEHPIPDSGVPGFNDNILLNNLVGMSLSKSEVCTDCNEKPSVDECEHCHESICSRCLVEHTKLAMELANSLAQLKPKLVSPTSHDQQVKLSTSRANLEGERTKMNDRFKSEATIKLLEVKILLERAEYIDKLMRTIGKLYETLGSEDEGQTSFYLNQLSEKVGKCTTVDSLKDYRNKMADLKTLLRLIETECKDEEFRFSYSTSPQDGPGQLEFGQAVVNVRGKYQTGHIVDQITQFVQDSSEILVKHVLTTCPSDHVVPLPSTRRTADAETETEEKFLIPEEDKKPPVGQEDKTSKKKVATANKVASKPDLEKASEKILTLAPDQLRSPEVPTVHKYRQNELPRRVDYAGKGKPLVIIGQGKSVKKNNKLFTPEGCAYHVERERILVTDWGHRRIMSYSESGRIAKEFYKHELTGTDHPIDDTCLRDLSVSSDGKHVYLVTPKSLIKINMDGRHVKTVKRISLGYFRICWSVMCHREFTVVSENSHRSLIVFNDNDKEVNCFGYPQLIAPRSVAVSDDGLFYVADGDSDTVTTCVKVFDWGGRCLQTFAAMDNFNGIWGIAVDWDGNVSVSRHDDNRIDVYSPQGKLLTSFCRSGRQPGELTAPCGICLTPDGKLMVADYENNRVQVF